MQKLLHGHVPFQNTKKCIYGKCSDNSQMFSIKTLTHFVIPPPGITCILDLSAFDCLYVILFYFVFLVN